jgi:hypothetical protein
LGIAEVGLDAELPGEPVVPGELGSVVEGDGSEHVGRHGFEDIGECLCGRFGLEVGGPGDEGDPGASFVGDEDRLAGFREEHGVGLPMARGLAVAGFRGAIVY